jgi:hypothetical protein
MVRRWWVVPFFLVIAGCSKKPAPAEPAPPTVKPEAKPARPAFDVRAASSTIAAHVWEGTVAGQPALFIAKARDGRLGGGLEIGKTQGGVQVRLDANRRISIQTLPRAVQGGLSYLTLSGTLNESLTEISGTVERVLKQGFVEQASGAGDFRLKRGISRAELAAKKKAAREGKAEGKAEEPEAKP